MSLFDIGISGLNAAQWGLTTTGQNISNAATPGYTQEKPVYPEAAGQYTTSGYLAQVSRPRPSRVHTAST